MPIYDEKFYRYVSSGAIVSAAEILPLLINYFSIKSVLDVGCAQGAWLAVWKKLGITDFVGLDGSFVDQNNLLIEKKKFVSHDLSTEFDLKRQFDIVQCLEVAEHLPPSSAAVLVRSLVRHGDLILFSAAPKGQGGDNHINEQDYDYWRAFFYEHGYQAIDYLRPQIFKNKKIEPWYRYNTFFYCSPERIKKLPRYLKSHLVTKSEPLVDISPLTYKIRKKIIAFMPTSLVTKIAKCNERILLNRNKY